MSEDVGMIRGLVGVLHLAPMPGDPGGESFEEVHRRALTDAEAYLDGGVHNLILENFGSAPFVKGTRGDRIPPHQAATLSILAHECRERFQAGVGINCLRNDAHTALGIAAATGADFVRVNVHIGAYVTDQGLIEGEAAETLRYREMLGASSVRILADVLVKHATPLAPLDAGEATRDTLARGGADGVIVTGAATGTGPSLERLRAVSEAAAPSPVYLGSGFSPERAQEFAPLCHGAIVGTWVKRKGQLSEPVDSLRVKELVAATAGCFRG